MHDAEWCLMMVQYMLDKQATIILTMASLSLAFDDVGVGLSLFVIKASKDVSRLTMIRLKDCQRAQGKLGKMGRKYLERVAAKWLCYGIVWNS